jgi:hypothetical protein
MLAYLGPSTERGWASYTLPGTDYKPQLGNCAPNPPILIIPEAVFYPVRELSNNSSELAEQSGRDNPRFLYPVPANPDG